MHRIDRAEAAASRPALVLALGILLAVGAVLAAVLAMGEFAEAEPLDESSAGGGVFLLLLALGAGVAAFGAFVAARWAWFAALGVAVVAAFTAVFALFEGEILAGVLALALAGAVLGLLFAAPVLAHFRVRRALRDVART